MSDRGYVEDAVDASVAAEIEPVVVGFLGSFARGEGDGADSAPASELRLGRESGRVADLAEKGCSGYRPYSGLVT